MRYLLDTGPLAAFLNEREKDRALRQWAVKTLSAVPWPLYTCEPVLTEAAYFLGEAAAIMEMVQAGDLMLPFVLHEHAAGVRRILGSYHSRQVSLADACLVHMAELWRDCTVITIDANDFSVYRRFGRERIPFISPTR